jgi:hypothetical protein
MDFLRPFVRHDMCTTTVRHMLVPFETCETRHARLDAKRRADYLRRFRSRTRAWATGAVPLDELCTDAGAALEAYATETLDVLKRAARDPALRASWILQQYLSGISAMGTALRDEISDASARHAVAQTLQERVLRAEVRFRRAATEHPHQRQEPDATAARARHRAAEPHGPS